jgi:hypothetical protein
VPPGADGVVRRRVVLHGGLSSVVDCAAASISIILHSLRSFALLLHSLIQVLYKLTRYRDLSAYGAQFYHGLPIVNGANLASVALELTVGDQDLFSSEWLESSLVHIGYCSPASLFLGHVLVTEDLNVADLFYENTVCLMESAVPKEDHLLLDELDHSLSPLVHTRNHSDYIAGIDGVVLGVNGRLTILKFVSLEFLAELRSSNVHNFAFLVDEFDGIRSPSALGIY